MAGLTGMSVDERLSSCGLLAEWQAAGAARDRPVMLAILADPAAYGL